MIQWDFNGSTISVRCPFCNDWGKLISRGRSRLVDEPKLIIKHPDGLCSVGKCTEYYEELLGIYNRCRKGTKRKSMKHVGLKP